MDMNERSIEEIIGESDPPLISSLKTLESHENLKIQLYPNKTEFLSVAYRNLLKLERPKPPHEGGRLLPNIRNVHLIRTIEARRLLLLSNVFSTCPHNDGDLHGQLKPLKNSNGFQWCLVCDNEPRHEYCSDLEFSPT